MRSCITTVTVIYLQIILAYLNSVFLLRSFYIILSDFFTELSTVNRVMKSMQKHNGMNDETICGNSTCCLLKFLQLCSAGCTVRNYFNTLQSSVYVGCFIF